MRRMLREWHWQRLKHHWPSCSSWYWTLMVCSRMRPWLDPGSTAETLRRSRWSRPETAATSRDRTGFAHGGHGGATEARARQLNINHRLVGIQDKPPALKALQQRLGIAPNNTGFVGDDLNDLAVRRNVKFYRRQVTLSANTPGRCRAASKGGHGAVRELAERVLKAGDLGNSCRPGWRDRNN